LPRNKDQKLDYVAKTQFLSGKFQKWFHSFVATVLYCTALYCTVLYCTELYCTVMYCTVLYCTALYCAVLYSTVLYYAIFYLYRYHRTVVHCSSVCKLEILIIWFILKIPIIILLSTHILFSIFKVRLWFKYFHGQETLQLCSVLRPFSLEKEIIRLSEEL